MSKYKIGWYADDLVTLDSPHHNIDEMDSDELKEFVEDMAKEFAYEHHQIDEESDMQFSVFVEVNGDLKEVNFKTEFDPVYYVDSID